MSSRWRCTLCQAPNVVGSKRCNLCRKPYIGDEPRIAEPIAIKEKTPEEEWEEDSKVLKELERRMERASAEYNKESIPPRGAIRIVIPNNPLGWLTVGIVVFALAMTLAILKTAFRR